MFFANEVMNRMVKEYPQTPDYYIEKGMQESNGSRQDYIV